MRNIGFVPAISVEVTSNEFEAWVKLSDQDLREQVRRLAESGLARAFGGTTDGIVRDGYGRLAGCTVYGGAVDAPQRGRFVVAHSGSLEICGQARAYIKHVQESLPGRAKEERNALPDPARSYTRDR